jgi:DNA-binding MarR family transcriptional regulator
MDTSNIVSATFGGVFAVVYECIASEKQATYVSDISEATSLSLSDTEHVVTALVREGFIKKHHMGYCRRIIPRSVALYVLNQMP